MQSLPTLVLMLNLLWASGVFGADPWIDMGPNSYTVQELVADV